jgi:hypothetical protein
LRQGFANASGNSRRPTSLLPRNMPLHYPCTFSISIVSHGHKEMVLSLLKDLEKLGRHDFEVILTWNLSEESTSIATEKFPYKIISILNRTPNGFAANHNAAFKRSSGSNFVVLNPDIRLAGDPFGRLMDVLENNPRAICAPVIVDRDDVREDSARLFPTPWFLAKKAAAKILRKKLTLPTISTRDSLLHPEWIAGMFMVIPHTLFEEIGGFSEKYFLYYEDVDLCVRARLKNIDILVTEKAKAIHNAQRESHRNARFFAWHLKSAVRFFCSKAYLAYQIRRFLGASN